LRLLLAELTDQPAHVLGCALGALPALHAVLAAPAMFAPLVAHDALAPALMGVVVHRLPPAAPGLY
ncbi:hypothetical protein, partial [Nocardia wallacei]|uniref:hypothetical protein n=1 Tax=Nocardia wallacei TaxID=480035 RepID=UPI002457B049